MSAQNFPLDHAEFDAMAKWYDFDYERRMRKDLSFYERAAAEGGQRVLELGSGTGRISLHLARAGYDVTGVELSSAMLERAEARLAKARSLEGSVRFLKGDMAELKVRGKFDAVLVPFRAFHHLYSIDRQLAALTNIRKSLAPDGIAVIDLFHPDLPELRENEGKMLVAYARKHRTTGHLIVQRIRLSCDHPRQMIYVDYYWDEYRKRRRINRDHAPMRWRWFHRYEFEHLLARAGLRPFRLCGDLKGSELRHDSEEMIFFVHRA